MSNTAETTVFPPMILAHTALSAHQSRQPMLRTVSGIDELQCTLLAWILARTKQNFTYYAPESFVVFAWGFCAGLAPTLLRQQVQITPTPNKSGIPDFLNGLILIHPKSRARFIIQTDYEQQPTIHPPPTDRQAPGT